MKKIARESAALRFLYRTVPGRAVLKLLTQRSLSRAAGRFLDSPLSAALIGPFARKNAIRTDDCLPETWRCFNDFFCRKIRPELRPLPEDPNMLVAPCDGLLTVVSIKEGTAIPVKQSCYTISALLSMDAVASRYRDGLCLVFRLCVDNYHRYCYLDDGEKGPNVFLPGRLHTVRPIALESVPVFIRNCREYTVMQTVHFGMVTQVEVGAMLVGRIDNYHGPGPIRRGDEKGRFLYGGSTIVLLLEKGCVELDDALLSASERGEEIPVRMGQAIGRALTTGQDDVHMRRH